MKVRKKKTELPDTEECKQSRGGSRTHHYFEKGGSPKKKLTYAFISYIYLVFIAKISEIQNIF